MSVSYSSLALSQLSLEKTNKEKKTSFSLVLKDSSGDVSSVKQYAITDRFISSLSRKIGASGLKEALESPLVESPNEVLQAIVRAKGDRELRITTQDGTGSSRDPNQGNFAWGVTLTHDGYIPFDRACEVFSGRDSNWSISGGVVSGTVPLSRLGQNFFVGKEEYSQKLFVQIPIDGLYSPTLSPAIVRLICTNGLVALTQEYTTKINNALGDDSGEILNLAIDRFNSDKHIDSLVSRLEKAKEAKASLSEVYALAKDFKLASDLPMLKGLSASKVLSEIQKVFGVDVLRRCPFTENYIGASRRGRKTPTSGSAYELYNMITELQTHFSPSDVTARDTSSCDAVLSRFIKGEFDFEESTSKKDLYQGTYFKAA
jgi:hypothetical protein